MTAVLSFLTGIGGNLFTGLLDFFKEKQRNEHELAMMKEARETQRMEIAGQKEIAAINAQKEKEVARETSFQSSIAADRATYSDPHALTGWAGQAAGVLLVSVDWVRGMTRPILTVWAVLFFSHTANVMLSAPAADARLVAEMTNAVIATADMALGWWFGTRAQLAVKGK